MEHSSTVQSKDFSDIIWDRGIKILTCALYFVASFILSGAGLLSLKAPLCVGLAAACTGAELAFVSAGGVAGAILRLSGADMINAVIPLAGTAGVVLILEHLGIKKKRRMILSVCVFAFCLASSVAVMFSEAPTLNGFILAVCSSLLCASSVTFYSGTAGASELSIMGFRPARFFGCFVIITAAYLFSRSGGSIAGIAIGCSIAVSGTSVALSICYSLCGMISGIFSKFGQIACALAFSLTAGAAALIDGSKEGISVFAEAAAAAFIFAAIPGRHLAVIRSNILNPKMKRIESEFCSAGTRLLEASKAIGSVSECVASVSKGIEALSPANDTIICMRVRERICSGCPLKDSLCPEQGEFSHILEKLSGGERITAEDFSVNFNSKCPSVPKIAECFNRVYASRSAVNALQANSARNRELACGQFDWMSSLLSELSEELGNGAQTLFGKEKSALRVLSEQGFNVLSVSCVQPLSGALRLSCIVEDIPPSTSLSQLTAAVSAELEVQLLPPKIREHKDGKELLFLRKELFKIRLGSAAASCGNQRLCGDYFECFQTESKSYIILSDGMGTGGRAAIDSTMTVELFSRLIRAGLSLDTALSITNSALSVKSEDESLSTLDVAEIDLFDGSTVILKAGAAPSFYTASGKVKTVEISSTPLGILSKVCFSRYSLKLHGGDTLVMVSDGVLGGGSGWIKDEIKAFGGSAHASEFSESVLDIARRKCGEKFDDMTVITAVAEEA